MGMVGLSMTGVGIDYIRHKVGHTPLSANRLHLAFPDAWPSLKALGVLAGVTCCPARAVLNYVYAVSVNILVQQKLVVDLRGEVYDKLQRLSFRFFDANTTGSIITRVTSDVQAVRMFVDQVLIQSLIMVISLTVYVIYMASLAPDLRRRASGPPRFSGLWLPVSRGRSSRSMPRTASWSSAWCRH